MDEVEDGVPVLQLDCSGKRFSGPIRSYSLELRTYYSIYYIPSPHRLIIISDNAPDNTIRAMSAETGEKVWEVKLEVDGEMYEPHSFLVSPLHQVLLVADGWNSRVLVLHAGNGSHLQTIQTSIMMLSLNCVSIKTNFLWNTMLTVNSKYLISLLIHDDINRSRFLIFLFKRALKGELY